ncbi:MAG: radical SAM peptide maturase [Bacteroidales bacterium]|nr:radical SAM peptide maturase [Bacteroidales bacterium]
MIKIPFKGGGSYYLLSNNTYYYLPPEFNCSKTICNNNYRLKEHQLANFLKNSKGKIKIGGRYNSDNIIKSIANTQSIDFEVTQKCNLKCIYCAFGKYYKRSRPNLNNDINIEYANILIDFLFNLFNHNELNYSFGKPIYIGFYGGEPLLNISGIKKIIAYIEKKTLKYNTIKYTMTTNGVLLDKNIKYLVEKDFSVSISLDGDQVHNGLRVFPDGSPSFELVFNNIKSIQSKFPAFFENNVNFLSVLNINSNELDINSFFSSNFNKEPKSLHLSKNDLDPLHRAEFYKNCVPLISNALNLSDYYKFTRMYSNRIKKTYLELFPSNNNNIKAIPTGTCVPFSKRVFITTEGKLLPCEKINHSNFLARVVNNSIKMNYSKIAKLVNEKIEKIETSCAKCIKKERCLECLFNLEYSKNSANCKSYSSNGNDEFFEDIVNSLSSDSKIFKQLINEYYEV